MKQKYCRNCRYFEWFMNKMLSPICFKFGIILNENNVACEHYKRKWWRIFG